MLDEVFYLDVFLRRGNHVKFMGSEPTTQYPTQFEMVHAINKHKGNECKIDKRYKLEDHALDYLRN